MSFDVVPAFAKSDYYEILDTHGGHCQGEGSAFLPLEAERPAVVQQAHVTVSPTRKARVRSRRWLVDRQALSS